MSSLYLDHNSTSPLDPRVRDEIFRCFIEEFGNAGSPHEFGLQAKELAHQARDRIGRCVGARRHEVLFTSGATESNNLAILGLAKHGIQVGKKHIVSSQIEHKAVLEPLESLKRQGFEITLVAPNSKGMVAAEDVLRAARADTLLVSLMHVNNETGIVQPITEIAEGLADRHDLFFHVDASQGFGKVATGLDHRRIDLISVSSHKVNGPVGIGALIARRRESEMIPLEPIMYGGGQELGLRPGTVPVALAAGFGLAAELAYQEMDERRQHCLALRGELISIFANLHPTYHGDMESALPHVVCVSFPQWDADAVIEALSGVAAVSTGSACTSICATASHVLSAMKVPQPQLDQAVRISWSYQTNREAFVSTLHKIAEKLAIS
jgi:cysteine desulfurase